MLVCWRFPEAGSEKIVHLAFINHSRIVYLRSPFTLCFVHLSKALTKIRLLCTYLSFSVRSTFNNRRSAKVKRIETVCLSNYNFIFTILACDEGYYGTNCSLLCSATCKTCRHTDGYCSSKHSLFYCWRLQCTVCSTTQVFRLCFYAYFKVKFQS